jgi:hypothetical protein
MTNFFDFVITFLRCFKSSTALASQNILRATSVKLVHTLSNNFYLRCFSIRSKPRQSSPVAYGLFFRFLNYLRFLGCFKSSPSLTSINISWATSVMLVHTVSNNFYLKCFSVSSKTGPSFIVKMANFFLFNYVFQDVSKVTQP